MSDTLQTNQERATAYLERFKANPIGHFINGEFTLGQDGSVRQHDTDG